MANRTPTTGLLNRAGCEVRFGTAAFIWMFALMNTVIYLHMTSIMEAAVSSTTSPFPTSTSTSSTSTSSNQPIASSPTYAGCDTLVQQHSNQLICTMMHALWDSFDAPPPDAAIHRVIPNILQRPSAIQNDKLDDELTSGTDRIVLATHLGVQKLDTLLVQARWWGGPVSAAVYMKSSDEIKSFVKFVEEHEFSLRHTSLHVVLEKTNLPYPHNILRNLAMDYLDGDFFVAADVDFIPTPDSHANLVKLLQRNTRVKAKLMKRTVFVLPAFERHMPNAHREVTEDLLPTTKAGVIEMVKSGQGNGFHMAGSWAGHGPTNYEKWMAHDTIRDDFYRIEYKNIFEPYILGYKRGIPRYWQGFRGYGFNKFSWFFEIHKAGYEFAVLRDFYVIHMNHPIPELKKKGEMTDWNRLHWKAFRDYLSKRYPQKKLRQQAQTP